MNMLGKAEEQYNDLIKKKKIVENDKAKINAVIAELVQKKKEALRQAWDQVNKDFGSIFSSLLPGTHAKLEPPQGQDGIRWSLEGELGRAVRRTKILGCSVLDPLPA